MGEKREKTTIVLIISVLLMMGLLTNFSNFYSITGNIIYSVQPDPTAGMDTYTIEGSPLNYGSNQNLLIGKTGGNQDLRPLIKFNLSSIPQSNTVINATLELYVTSSNNENEITLNTYQITSNWNQSETTWLNSTSSTSWSSAGGDYSTLINSTTINQTGWYSIDITSITRNWIDGSTQNYGLILYAPTATAEDFKEFASSDNTDPTLRPKITINHVSNAVPTINTITTDSSSSSPKLIGESITFTLNWTDLESDDTQIYICNSSSINLSGCTDTTFCSSSLAQTNPATCEYTVLDSDNKTTSFWAAACDARNCSTISSENFFYINHLPAISLTQPNGGETVNQSLGNYSILFDVNDTDSDSLTANIYYGTTENSTTNLIQSNINLTTICTDSDSDTATSNNCTYPWNSSGIYGTFFLTIILNDSISTSTESSTSSFDVRSIVDDQAPQITYSSIDSDIYSGETIQVDATITDDNTITAWIAFNYTSTNQSMTNTTLTNFRGSFQAPSVGTHQYKIYAQDLPENLNDSTSWQTFTVRKPIANTSNENSPSTALPFHTIKITGDINTTDSLTSTYAYLNVPSSFTFLQDYPQNAPLEDLTAGETETTTWYISTPIAESTYTFNITYTDQYSNSWQSSNFQTQVTSAIGGGYDVEVSGYPEVEATGTYYAESNFKQAGQLTTPDSIEITLYDSAKNQVTSTAMTQKSTGIYNYSYAVGAAPMAGQWETVINATVSGTSYYTNEFWKVVGALFDVRNITIANSSTSNMNISVILENIGNNPTDLFLQWNLTREDNGTALDSGFDTIGVGATPITHYISPSTTYIGQTRITFMGVYLNTEKAAAYKIFSTTDGGEAPVIPQTGEDESSGGGGGGDTPETDETQANETQANTTNIRDIIIEEFLRLDKKLKDLNKTLIQQEFLDLSNDLNPCKEILNTLESNIEKEEFINAQDDIINAEDCIKKIEDKSKQTELSFTDIKMTEYWVWIITWSLILILIIILIMIIHILHKKFNLMSFVKQKQSEPTQPATRTDKMLSEKLRKIKENLD